MDDASTPPFRRRSPRISLNHTAVLRVAGNEVLCKTYDMSEEGIGLVVLGSSVRWLDEVEIDVLFGQILKTFKGTVAFVSSFHGGKTRVGIRFNRRGDR
ncbi:MAG: PilZ domain-containing protein [Deltaproteobacteria bacterium]|nr:PilZ domain-containing protein [Deltaproteobacteria bacterium]